MAEDVFTQTEGTNENTPQADVNPVEELVGEGKKFKTVEDLAKGKLEADSYIAQLEGENKLVREKLAEIESSSSKEATISELIKAVRDHQSEQGTDGNNQVSDEDLSNRIKAIMQGESEAQTRAKNRELANQAVLDKVNGDVEAAKSYVAERAKELGMSVKSLSELGEKSPEAFAKLVEVNPKSTVSPGVSSLPGRTPENQGQTSPMEIDGHKTKAYYDKLKAEMGPSRFWNDTKIQGAMFKDNMALGDRFNQ